MKVAFLPQSYFSFKAVSISLYNTFEMVSTHSDGALEEAKSDVAKAGESDQTRVSQKRKSYSDTQEDHQPLASKRSKNTLQSTPPAEENKENENRPSTPPPATPLQLTQHEKTPGRVGPIKPTLFSAEPDIKPFKGPRGKKVRKTWQEKEDEYAQFARENEDHCFHEFVIPFLSYPIPTLSHSNLNAIARQHTSPKRYLVNSATDTNRLAQTPRMLQQRPERVTDVRQIRLRA